ncbi:DUF1800 domain-containing protein [Pseudonocardia spinosispora]|uniref:DUF1800 domain-containing protein n=1 Tax=Pseudonocardia spinosispora TaxID=103441 RepID=UPI00041713E6|nr:DUF1800 domain-containing protein [Pseudonocardia spinosispora]
MMCDERAAIRRLHDRLGFGAPAPADGRGFEQVLDDMLDPAADPGASTTPLPALEPLPPKPKNNGPADPAAKKQAGRQLRAQQNRLVLWWLDRMSSVRVPTTERMTWFWHGHFATGAQKVRSPKEMLDQNETQRRLGLGGFHDLAEAMIVDQAMLRWLDGGKNRVGAANENLAREFMELFTLGVGHYTEDDVRESARALTGWTVRPALADARFVVRRHDTGEKRILGSSGDFDAPDFVQLVLSRPESAPFVAGRLWFRLVSPTPPSQDVLDRMIAGYGPGRDVRGLLRAMFGDPAFRDPANGLVKQPVEWLVGLSRAVGVRPGQLPAAQAEQVLSGLRAMGQVPFAPPSVGGWSAGGGWLTTSAGLARLHLAQTVTRNGSFGAVTSASTRARPDAVRELLGVDAWSPRTQAALAGVADDPATLTAVASCAPEYVVSA